MLKVKILKDCASYYPGKNLIKQLHQGTVLDITTDEEALQALRLVQTGAAKWQLDEERALTVDTVLRDLQSLNLGELTEDQLLLLTDTLQTSSHLAALWYDRRLFLKKWQADIDAASKPVAFSVNGMECSLGLGLPGKK